MQRIQILREGIEKKRNKTITATLPVTKSTYFHPNIFNHKKKKKEEKLNNRQ